MKTEALYKFTIAIDISLKTLVTLFAISAKLEAPVGAGRAIA